jgi:iduronate 2-sulfatase
MKGKKIIYVLIALLFTGCSVSSVDIGQKKNVLLIIVDDLKPALGCYGENAIKTPHIDKLAEEGLLFERTYCQVPICGASRASIMSGIRPTNRRFLYYNSKVEEDAPDQVTLPQVFKQNNYHTISNGKVFHITEDTESKSWSEPAWLAPLSNKAFLDDSTANYIGGIPDRTRGPWFEGADVDDFQYTDGQIALKTIKDLERMKKDNKNFFIACGFYRPHLPFYAPKKYWDMYDRNEIPLAKNQFVPEGTPAYLVHGEAELRGYSDCHYLPLPNEDPWDENQQREIKHGYYASVSYTDAQIGRLLDELERLGLLENTIVVLWGDHGWKLGEHNGWCKQTNYEIDTRVPMIISGQGVKAKGKYSNALTEFVDIYPTLCEMANLPIPEHLQGTSFVPLLENPDAAWKTAAFSQFLLGRYGRTKTIDGEQMGYAIRTDQYRYVEWYSWNKEENKADTLICSELFDHNTDPQENKNVVAEIANKVVVEELSEQLKKGWRYSKPK